MCADPVYQAKLVPFIENHDEPRALAAFSAPKACVAAVTVATLPGAKLFHEGQFEGRKVRLPVFLGRRPEEPTDPELQAFYRTLMKTASSEALRRANWRLCDQAGWADNTSCRNLVAWCWHGAGERHLIVVNLSASVAQGRIQLPWDALGDATWRMTDLFTATRYDRSGDEMGTQGLYVDLPPWGCHVLRWERLS